VLPNHPEVYFADNYFIHSARGLLMSTCAVRCLENRFNAEQNTPTDSSSFSLFDVLTLTFNVKLSSSQDGDGESFH
jgi:hypothetical protein